MKKEPKRSTDDAYNYLWKLAQEVNAADQMEDTYLDELGQTCCDEYEIDLGSRSEWAECAEKALDAVGMKREGKNYPWPNAANVKFPLLLEAVMQYNARSYPAIVSNSGVVQVKTTGADPDGAKRARAERVSKFMSWQFLERMDNWEEDTDVLLMQQPVVGCVFRKIYEDPDEDCPRSEMVSALDFVVNNNTKSLDTTPRKTHRFPLYPHEVEQKVQSGIYRDVDYDMESNPDGETTDADAPHEFIEQHRYIDLDGDGTREPWIVTIHRSSNKVARIEAGFNHADIKLKTVRGNERITKIPCKVTFIKYAFVPDPSGGFYDYGFGKITESLIETINSSLNQMLDAGHLQTAGGGFIGQGMRLNDKGTIRQTPGKYWNVKTSGSNIRDSVYTLDHKGPSPVLFQLLGLLIDSAKGLTSIQDVMTGDVQRSQTATTTLALIEQGMKVYTAIYKRVYRSLKQEFQLVYKMNAKKANDSETSQTFLKEYVEYHDEQDINAQTDFMQDGNDIIPVADPNMVLDMQKASKAQLLLENSQNPELKPFHNVKAALERVYSLLNIDVQDILVEPQPDPAQEQMQGIAKAGEAANVEKTQAEIRKLDAEAEEIRAEAEAAAFGDEAGAELAQFADAFTQPGTDEQAA